MRFEDVSKAYGGKAVLSHFSLVLPEEGAICLFGPSGCGKTTLLRLAAGLIRPDAGRIRGIPARIAYVFQEDRLLAARTARENVAVVMKRAEQADAYLETVGLRAFADAYPGELSGGMRRRLCLARALAFGGELLILDEPFQGLDAAAAETLMKLALGSARTLLLVTHDIREARAADTVLHFSGPPLTRLD